LVHIVLIVHVISGSIPRPKTRGLVIGGRGENVTQWMPRKIPDDLLVRFMDLCLTVFLCVRVSDDEILDISRFTAGNE